MLEALLPADLIATEAHRLGETAQARRRQGRAVEATRSRPERPALGAVQVAAQVAGLTQSELRLETLAHPEGAGARRTAHPLLPRRRVQVDRESCRTDLDRTDALRAIGEQQGPVRPCRP